MKMPATGILTYPVDQHFTHAQETHLQDPRTYTRTRTYSPHPLVHAHPHDAVIRAPT